MRKKEFVKPIDFSYLYLITSGLHIHSAGIALIETINGLNLGTDRHHDKSFTLVMCKTGHATVRINNTSHRLHPQNALIITPESIYQLVKMDADCQLQCISLSEEFTANILSQNKQFSQMIAQARKSAHVFLEPDERLSLQRSYELIKHKFENGELYSFFKDQLEYLVMALFLEAYGYMLRYRLNPHDSLTKNEQVFQQFIQLVARFHKSRHLATDYAKEIGISAKYLAAIVKSISNRSAKEWIDSYIITTARELLVKTDKSIQQISNELEFSDQAFFCKFFKRSVQLSPKDYRKIHSSLPPAEKTPPQNDFAETSVDEPSGL